MNQIKIVAEIGINHNGDLEKAKQLISVAYNAGCDFVKFQKRAVDVVYSAEELNKYRESPWGITNREQKEGLEFGAIEYDEIDGFCNYLGIGWFASPWDVESVKFITQYNIPFIKVASACLTNTSLLNEIKKANTPVILSTGMSSSLECHQAIDFLYGRVVYILACTSTYPTQESEMNLNFIQTLNKEYPDYKIGFSNHHPGIFYSSVAAALGAEMIEFHLTLDRATYGSDQAASIEPAGAYKLVKYIRGLEKAMGTGAWTVFESEKIIKNKLRKNG